MCISPDRDQSESNHGNIREISMEMSWDCSWLWEKEKQAVMGEDGGEDPNTKTPPYWPATKTDVLTS